MLIQDDVNLKVTRFRKGDKVYETYFVSFSIKYSDILSKFKELHNVEIIAGDKRIVLPKVNLYKHSYYYRKKTGEKIPLISFTVPKIIAEELRDKGIKKLKVIVEIPEVPVVKS